MGKKAWSGLEESGIAAAAILAAGLVVVVINLALESRAMVRRRDEDRSKEIIARGKRREERECLLFFSFEFKIQDSRFNFQFSITEYDTEYCKI